MIVEYERRHGREVRDVSHKYKGGDLDVVGDRRIEVKVTEKTHLSEWSVMSATAWNRFRRDDRSWLYIIYDWGRRPRLVKIHRDEIKLSQIRVSDPPSRSTSPQS